MKLKSGVLAFLFTGVVLLWGFYMGGMFPFGSGTVSWCDMNQQAIPLLCDFKDILAGNDGMFLNTTNASGMNFYGVFFFFLSSPFSFLVAFIDKADIPFLMNVLVILKLCLAAFTAAYSFGKLFPKLGSGLTTVLGVSYALCGYGMLFYQNIMWLDIMYLFPIVTVGIYKLIKEEKPLVLFLSLSGCVILNYYISFMVFLFVIILFGLFALFYRNTNRRIYVNLGFCGIFSLICTAVVWVPSFLQYTVSGRGSGILAELKNSDFFSSTDTTIPLLLCSGIVFAVFGLAIPKLSVAEKNTKFLFTVFVLTAIPLVVEPVNLMWHTGSYMSFPARYGFITVYMGLSVVADWLSNTEFAEKSNKIFTVLSTVAVCGLAVVMWNFADKNVNTLSAYVKTLWGDEYSLKGLILLCLFGVLAYLIVLLCIKHKQVSRNAAVLLLCIVVAAEGLCGVRIYMATAKNKLNLYNYQSFLSLENQAKKEGFYRVNAERKLTDANMTGAAGFNSISHYTSLNDKTTMETAKQLGYSGYWMETGNWGGSIISDTLLSVGYTVKSANGNFELTENPYFLGLGIKAQGEIKKTLSHKDRLMATADAFAALTGGENPVVKYQPDSQKECVYYTSEGQTSIISTATEATLGYKISVKSRQTLYFDCYNGFSNSLEEEVNNSFAVYVDGELLEEAYPTQRQNGLLRLGSFENTEVDITLGVLKNTECCSFGVFGVDEGKFAKALENTESLNLAEKNGKFIGNAREGKYFISLPYRENYKITLNGEKLDYSKVLGGFIAVDMPYDGELTISSTPDGFVFGFIVSGLGVVLAAAFLILSGRIKNTNEAFENIVFGVFYGVFIMVVSAVYIIPIVVNLSDLRI